MLESTKNISKIHHPSGALGFGLVTYQPNGKLGPRLQGHYQLVVIHRGSLSLTLDGKTIDLPAGHGILLRPEGEEFFQFSPHAETTHSWCQISHEILPPTLRFSAYTLGRAAICSAWLLDFMLNGWKLNGRAQDHMGKMLISAVTMAMWDFCAAFALAKGEQSPLLPISLSKMERLMEKRLAEPLSLDDLSRHAAVSKNRLIQLAKLHWNATPMERLWSLRIERSAQLLRETGLSISEIAYATGFSNPFHFSRRFKQHYGKSPRAWRRTEWTEFR